MSTGASDEMVGPVHILDARRLLCPMPVIRLQQLVATLTPGELVDMVCSDPGALHDVPAWCRVHGHVVLETAEVAGEITIRVRVDGTA